jgi:hypothetical protein
MKKLFVVIALAVFAFGCTTLPTDSSLFGPEEIGAVHYAAEGLDFEEASYLFVGKGSDFMVSLSYIDTEFYPEAFSVKQSIIAPGIYNKFIQLAPGEHDLSLYAVESGVHKNGMVQRHLKSDVTFDFAAGFVYVFDQLDSGDIIVKYWKIGSQEVFENKIELTEKAS